MVMVLSMQDSSYLRTVTIQVNNESGRGRERYLYLIKTREERI